MNRRLLMARVGLLALLAGIAMCGAGARRGYQGGYASPYKVASPGYGHGSGGGPAPTLLDTFTVVFTTQDVLTKSLVNPTSIDTSLVKGLPASEYGSTAVTADFARRLIFTQRLALADSVHQIGTGDSTKVKSFAYGVIDTAVANGYLYAAGHLMTMWSPTKSGSTINRRFNVLERRSILMYVPFEKYIPSGATVLSAYVNTVSPSATTTLTAADSVICVQNSAATDNKWYTVKGVGPLTNYAHAAWQRQISNKGTAWTGSNSDPWNPSISTSRANIAAWGTVSDETSVDSNFVTKGGKDFSIKNCVQAVVDGAANNGIVMNLGVKTDVWDRENFAYVFDNYSDAIGRTGYFVVTYTPDTSAPAPPSGLYPAVSTNGVFLEWTASADPDSVYYNVYRFYDGATDTQTIATHLGLPEYYDTPIIKGSPHNYFVSALDAAGNESFDSNVTRAVPVAIMNIPRPAYMAIWFQDPGASVSSATLDSLAAYDAIVTGPFAMEGATSEPAYTGMLSELRARNSDIIVLQYIHSYLLRIDGGGANRSPYKRMLAYANTEPDSAGYCRADDDTEFEGGVVWGKQYLDTALLNYTVAGAADTIAFIWAEAYDKISRLSGTYTGLYVDDLVVNPAFLSWTQDGLGGSDSASDLIDADQNGTVFSDDTDEQEAFQQFQITFVKGLRREFAQRGLNSRLIVANSSFGRTGETDNAVALMELLDGAMIEGPNLWWPGNAAAQDTTWDRAFSLRNLLTNTQISPPMQIFQMQTDSNTVNQSEILALANDSWVSASGDMHPWQDIEDRYGNHHVQPLYRRLPWTGIPRRRDIIEGGADGDTLVSEWWNYTAKMVLRRNPAQADSTYAVWPYVITDNTKLPGDAGYYISRSAYWEID